MKEEYIKRYHEELKFSQRQLEQISAHHIVDLFMENMRLESLSEINPKWIDRRKYKEFSIWYSDELKKKGIWDNGRIKIRKTKKGYVFEMKFKWTSKGILKKQYLCRRCKKAELLNWELLCKKCTKHLKKKRQFSKFWMAMGVVLKK